MNIGNGVIFDIHRFSINDGPGIRTTIFLKGCSLKCTWCHNPESQSFKPQLSFSSDKCINCFNCVKACSNGVHVIEDGLHRVKWDLCRLDGNCVDVCYSDALKIIGTPAAAADVVAEVLKDTKYYIGSGGGVTISGGEPLSQFTFLKDLLIKLKQENIHTCVDTCGMGKTDHYREILPYTDLFLFDYKLSDTSRHKLHTGAGNELILGNLEFLYNSAASIILRCPIVPGLNNDEQHLNGIRDLMIKYPMLKAVELMPYHNMGKDKAASIGRDYALQYLPTTDEAVKKEWVEFFRKNNLTVICN